MLQLHRNFLFYPAVPTIGFQQLLYSFDEGSTEEVCVTVDHFVEGPSLIAILAYFPITASKNTKEAEMWGGGVVFHEIMWHNDIYFKC